MKSLSYKQWKESLGGVGEPSSSPINPNEPTKNPNSSLVNIRPTDMKLRMQKLRMTKPIQ